MKRNSVLFVVLLLSMLTLPAMGAGRKDIAPLLTTQWGNGMPFSNDCWVRRVVDVPPTHIDTVYVFQNPTWGVSSYAQLMRFHEISGTENWLSMKNMYEKTDQDADALAALYGDIVRKTWMQFNNPIEILHLLGFKQETLREWSLSDFDLSEWEDMVYQELAEGRPVLIYSSGYYGLCDGYKDGLFHFNFGSNGEGDGYSRLTCPVVWGPNRQLPVSHQGSYLMKAYTGIQPADGTGLAQEHLAATIQPDKGRLDDLVVEKVTLKGNMTEGCPQEVELVVFNKGEDMRSDISFGSDRRVDGGYEKGSIFNHFTIKAGMRDTLHMVYYLPAGNREVWANLGGSAGPELFRQVLTIKKLGDEWAFEPLWTLNDGNDQHVLPTGCKVEGELQLKNLEQEMYYNKLQMVWQLERNDEYVEMSELSRDYIVVQPGETLTIPFSFIQMPKEGEKYRLVLRSALDWVTTKDLASYEFEVNGATGIRQAMASEADDVWYTLQGVRLNAKPSQRGIYIKNGRKVSL